MAWEDERYIKDSSRANRGREFESFINFANDKYQANGVAVMHKVPTEFIPLRGPRGQIISCKVDKKSCVDYLGNFRGIPVAVEAKHTQTGKIDFSAVQDHQAAYMDDWQTVGGIALVLVSFGLNRFYAVPWDFWKAGRDAWERHKRTGEKKVATKVAQFGWEWQSPGTASVKPDSLYPEWEIKPGGYYGLPYLQIIEKIAGGNKEYENRGPGR